MPSIVFRTFSTQPSRSSLHVHMSRPRMSSGDVSSAAARHPPPLRPHAELHEQVERVALELYRFAATYALERGIVVEEVTRERQGDYDALIIVEVTTDTLTRSVAGTVVRTTQAAMERYPGLPILCSGGVASNRRLRRAMTATCGALFAQPRYSTDNAMGTAILTWRARTSQGG